MATPDASADGPPADETLWEEMLDVLMTGIAIIVPLVVTIYLIEMGLDFVTDALQPFIRLLEWAGIIQQFERVELISALIELGIYRHVIDFLTEIIAVFILLGGVVLVGSVGQHHYGQRVIGFFDMAISSIPGIGTVYKSFRRMGDVMLDEGAENFKEIKLVQSLDDDMYLLAFETASSPATVEEATGHEEMVTLFIPMAPNPVTGGFLTHVPEHKVYDVDMTIEEGVRSILTSGIAAGDGPGKQQLTMGDLDQLTDIDLQEAITVEDPGLVHSDDDEKSE
ncbi:MULTISPECIES: DUF502 domain-containing protein [Halorussus]|uniref:DUF502 domain-containing protein n=1 Tax=Halorussus TaxID=1070314 RepID=UPI00209F825A|nr:DUF502 domain-containing protein [Halorussus vallis]USZ76952.1 DUF502 domain-containing protein [Halorussus vallis]